VPKGERRCRSHTSRGCEGVIRGPRADHPAPMTKITHVSWAMFGLLPHPIRDSAPVVASPSRFDFILDAQPGCCTLPGTHPDDRGNIAEPSRVDWEVHSRDLVVRANAVCVLPSNSAARYRFHAHRQEGPRKLFNSSGVRFHVSAAKPPPSRRVDVAWMSCLGHARPHGSLVHRRAIGETAAGPPRRIAVQEDERPHWSPTPRYSAQPGSRHDWGKNREGPHQHADPCAR
jgi:hypothetical protein